MGTVSAVAAPKYPTLQLVHVAAPTPLYCPAGQRNDVPLVDPGGHANPALHSPLHVDAVRPTAPPKYPARHGPLHTDDVSPAVAPYWPCGHGVQAPEPAVA